MEKVKLPRNVAEAIEEVRVAEERSETWDGRLIKLLDRQLLGMMEWNAAETITEFIDANIENTAKYFHAVTDGYEIDMTPEDKVRELYMEYKSWEDNEGPSGYESAIALEVITKVIGFLNIRISGVNAE